MRIAVHAVGRMKAGPDKELAERYFDRFSRTGPALGLEFSGVMEIAESRAQTAGEAMGLDSSIPHLFKNLGTTPARGIWFVRHRHD